MDEKGPRANPDKLRGGLRGGPTDSETRVTLRDSLK